MPARTRERPRGEQSPDGLEAVEDDDLGADPIVALEVEGDGYTRASFVSRTLIEGPSRGLDVTDHGSLGPELLGDEDGRKGSHHEQPDYDDRDRVTRASVCRTQAPEALSEPRTTTTEAPPACGRISELIGWITPTPTAEATSPASSSPAGSK